MKTDELLQIYELASRIKEKAQKEIEETLTWQELAWRGFKLPAILKYRKMMGNKPSLLESKQFIDKWIAFSKGK